MRRLGPYGAAVVPSFADLVAGSTEVRRRALEPLRSSISAACAEYDATSPDVHGIRPIKLTEAERTALIGGYDNRTVAIKRLLAEMVASLSPADADLCPYCSLDTNPDLDHFLPKSVFPEFSLHARNLIPICTPCNRKKQNAFKANGGRIFLHPSAEPSGNAKVIEAVLTFKASAVKVNYQIDDGGKLSSAELERVKQHYVRLGLSARYSRRAHSHLASMKASVIGKDRSVVFRILQEKINTASVGEPINGWRPALYRAIANAKITTLTWLLQ